MRTTSLPDAHAQLRDVLTKVDQMSSHLSDMEFDVNYVQGYAQLIGHLASSPHCIEPDLLLVLADGMETMQRRLRERWEQASALVREVRRS
jgi:deoxyadenosine/deoxycytidine kinase